MSKHKAGKASPMSADFTSTSSLLVEKILDLRELPTIPAVLVPLLRYLEQPAEQIDMQKVTELISQDKSLAAQCLQMANSPLFGRWQKVDSLRAAILGLGFQRVSDIAMSCSVLNLTPDDNSGIDPIIFWEHSLGCALVCRHLARKISYPDPQKAYLAGLLHDLGIIVNLWSLPEEFRSAYNRARADRIPLHEAEQTYLEFTHCDSGRLLAEAWDLPPDLKGAVSLHHSEYDSHPHAGLIAVVELSDLLCRMSGLNYGYAEHRQINMLEQRGFAVLSEKYPALKNFDWARLTFELDSYLDEVHALVHAIYRK
jgi:HD-like signal output (HDOD) protein